MIQEERLNKYFSGDILDLQYDMDKVGEDIKIYTKANNKIEAMEKIYEVLQLYSIKFKRIKPPIVDKHQINILIKLYKTGERKFLKIKPREIPKFAWIK